MKGIKCQTPCYSPSATSNLQPAVSRLTSTAAQPTEPMPTSRTPKASSSSLSTTVRPNSGCCIATISVGNGHNRWSMAHVPMSFWMNPRRSDCRPSGWRRRHSGSERATSPWLSVSSVSSVAASFRFARPDSLSLWKTGAPPWLQGTAHPPIRPHQTLDHKLT